MKMKAPLMLVGITLVTLVGCNTTTQTTLSCGQFDDWRQAGYNFAVAGKTVRSHENYIERCKLNFNEQAKENYLSGYEQGLGEFCTFETGHKLGIKGEEDPNVCPYEIRAEYEKGYKKGLLVYQEKQKQVEYQQRMRELRGMQSSANSASGKN